MEVFYTSPWVPPEWIKAHGLEPRGIWLASDFACGPLPLAAGVCAFANAAVRLAEHQTGSAVIFTTHCDQLRRGFDTVAGAAAPRVFLFNLPVTWQTPVAERIYADELKRLGRFLVGLGGHAPVVTVLVEIIRQYSRARQRLLEAAPWCPARAYAEAVARFHLNGSVTLPPEPGCPQPQQVGQQQGAHTLPRAVLSAAAAVGDSRAPGTSGIPLALVGGPLPQSQMPLLDAIEKAGGRVVLNATEAGERSLWPASPLDDAQPGTTERSVFAAEPSINRPGQDAPAPVSSPEPCSVNAALLTLLARGCLANCVDVFQRPNTRLYDWLRERLTTRQVCGIVLWHYVGCDLWRAEAQPMREAFGLPVLLVEADEAAPNRNTGRLEAFLESLR
ncbi:MAG: 2-hydroxyacyl-CoA dehydratase family protein [Limisphaerales bacterium]